MGPSAVYREKVQEYLEDLKNKRSSLDLIDNAIDNMMQPGYVGFYSNFVQIPVKITPSSFLVKTRLNDKSSISYTIELEETNNFINNIL